MGVWCDSVRSQQRETGRDEVLWDATVAQE
jgi:hypothetical protein